MCRPAGGMRWEVGWGEGFAGELFCSHSDEVRGACACTRRTPPLSSSLLCRSTRCMMSKPALTPHARKALGPHSRPLPCQRGRPDRMERAGGASPRPRKISPPGEKGGTLPALSKPRLSPRPCMASPHTPRAATSRRSHDAAASQKRIDRHTRRPQPTREEGQASARADGGGPERGVAVGCCGWLIDPRARPALSQAEIIKARARRQPAAVGYIFHAECRTPIFMSDPSHKHCNSGVPASADPISLFSSSSFLVPFCCAWVVKSWRVGSPRHVNPSAPAFPSLAGRCADEASPPPNPKSIKGGAGPARTHKTTNRCKKDERQKRSQPTPRPGPSLSPLSLSLSGQGVGETRRLRTLHRQNLTSHARPASCLILSSPYSSACCALPTHHHHRPSVRCCCYELRAILSFMFFWVCVFSIEYVLPSKAVAPAALISPAAGGEEGARKKEGRRARKGPPHFSPRPIPPLPLPNTPATRPLLGFRRPCPVRSVRWWWLVCGGIGKR